MSTTTPLVSLSVHEALHLDGTEVALHPDLFSDVSPGNNAGGGASIVSSSGTRRASGVSVVASLSSAGPAPRPNHRHTQSENAGVTGSNALPRLPMLDRDGRIPSTATADTAAPNVLPKQSSMGSSMASTGTSDNNNSVSSSSRLEVGNMIEIRVWDALPTRDKRRSSNSSPSNQRVRSSPPPSLVSSARSSGEVSEETTETKHHRKHHSLTTNTSDTLEAAASSLQTSLFSTAGSSLQMSFPSPPPSNASLQYSIESTSAATPASFHHPPRSSPPGQDSKDGATSAASKLDADVSTLSSGGRKKDETPLSLEDSPKKDDSNGPDVPTTVLTPTRAGGSFPPPLFPRSRANTGDAPPPRPPTPLVPPSSSATGPSKPQTVQRNQSTQTIQQRRLAASSPVQKPASIGTNRGHIRDISDMTADTIAFTGGFSGPDTNIMSVPSTDTGMPSIDSGDDMDDEDMLSKVSTTHQMRLSFVMLVTEKTLTTIKSSARTQVSILRQIADLYNLSSYDMVTITKIEKPDEASVLEEVSADFVMVTIKDQHLSRGDMDYFQQSLLGRWIYEGERLSDSKLGVNAHAREIRHANRFARSGIVTKDTKFTFRSRSARIIWLVQISSEMWEYASPYEAEHGINAGHTDYESSCEIYFDKFVTFMYRLFEKWKELEATHCLTVIFFSRTFLGTSRTTGCTTGSANEDKENVDVYGRHYEDHYKTVIEDETTDWDSLALRIKTEFVKYPFEVGWNLSSTDRGRRPSNAMQGNVLEAINVTLNVLQLHYMDRDLHRTGNSIVVVSAGCGVFEVDKGLAGITYQRMMDNGIGSDMLSLGLPPLHIAPFFLYNNDFFAVEAHGVDASTTYYEVPHWMHLSFVSYDDELTRPAIDRDEQKLFHASVSFVESSPEQINVAANGFLLPRMTPEPYTEDTHSSPSSSPIAPSKTQAELQTAKSPDASRIQTHQRQLISGRDFEDILEACKPRNSGYYLPSTLMSLLRMQQQAKSFVASSSEPEVKMLSEEDRKGSSGVDTDGSSVGSRETRKKFAHVSAEKLKIKEWDSVDFDVDDRLIRTSNFKSSQTVDSGGSPLLAALLSPLDDSDRSASSDKSSPSSSFASVYSHMMLGKSCERGTSMGSYLSGHNFLQPAGLGGIQIQRSPSLDLSLASREDETEEADMARTKGKRSNDSLSTMGNEERAGSTMQSEKGEMARRGPSQDKQANANYVEHLRKIMSQRDATFFTPVQKTEKQVTSAGGLSAPPVASVSVTSGSSGRNKPVRALSQASANMNSGGHKQGGIGAALVQYNKSGGHAVGKDMKRIRSVGMISSGTFGHGHSKERDSRPISPGFVGMPLSSDPPESVHMFRRHRSQGPPGDLSFRGILTPDGKPLQSRDGKASRRHSGNLSGNFLPPIVSTPSDDSQQSGQNRSGLVGLQPNVGMSSTGIGSRLIRTESPPTESKLSPSRENYQSSHTGKKGEGKKKHQRHGHFSVPLRSNHDHHSSNSKPVRSSHNSRQRKSVFNPFRQQDEEEVLAKKSHNRRRWSHVFPPGEVEFKRHAGPNWKSLCQPACLPLTIDFHPSPQELKDENLFYFNPYSITLGAIESSYYTTHAELLMEMVRQRLSLDFQVVPQSVIRESTRRGEAERKAKLIHLPQTNERENTLGAARGQRPLLPTQAGAPRGSDDTGTIQHTLSMGHKIHELTYQKTSDTIEVVQYVATSSMHDPMNNYKYHYELYSPSTQKYVRMVQTFHKYFKKYRWNQVDNMICGDSDKTFLDDMQEMRHRRLMFGLIPERFSDLGAEQEYIDKFKELLKYLSKLRQVEGSPDSLDIRIISSTDARPEPKYRKHGTIDSMRRFTVHLRKSKRDRYEWLEMAVDSTFDTSRSYRIMVNWLVATASKIETQIQLLHRRCAQFGLKLVPLPQTSVSRDLLLHPFVAPSITAVRDEKKAKLLDGALLERDFVDDGIYMTEPNFMDCVENTNEFDFPLDRRKRPKNVPARQYVHRSGTLFVRLLQDEKGWVLLVTIMNLRRISEDNEMRRTAMTTFQEVSEFIASLTGQEEEP